MALSSWPRNSICENLETCGAPRGGFGDHLPKEISPQPFPSATPSQDFISGTVGHREAVAVVSSW